MNAVGVAETMARRQQEGIPADRLERNPLITAEGYRLLKSIQEHPDAPAWNYEVGDRVVREDLPHVETVRAAVRRERRAGSGAPPDSILEWVHRMRPRTALFRRRLPEGTDVARDWGRIPTMTREDLAARIEHVVPADEDLSRLVVYDTSGVTGHVLRVPHHPRAMAQNHALMEFALAQHGVNLAFGPDRVACFNVGAQLETVVFAGVFSVWNNAGFVKVGLHDRRWSRDKARRFFRELSPMFLTGDPVGYAEMLRWEIDIRPAALISTAVTLAPGLKARLESAYGCPVIDSYATTETGVIAYSTPGGTGLSVLPTDVYVEVVDESGQPVSEGERGEICVTGGRNPFVPLLRYRTGDYARLVWSRPPAADPMPQLLDLEARKPVSFVTDDGTRVGPIDVGRILRLWIFTQHTFLQRADRSCELVIRPAPGCPVDTDEMRRKLQRLMGPGIPIAIRLDPQLGDHCPGGKTIPFLSELPA